MLALRRPRYITVVDILLASSPAREIYCPKMFFLLLLLEFPTGAVNPRDVSAIVLDTADCKVSYAEKFAC